MLLKHFDTVPVGLCVVDAENPLHPCLYANAAFQTIVASNALGQPLAKFLPNLSLPQNESSHRSMIVPAERTGSVSKKLTVQISKETIDGRRCLALWCQDISQDSTFGSPDRNTPDLLATISHEIRSPMQSVYGLLELIELEASIIEASRMAKTARSAADGIIGILDDVLDYAKLEAEHLKLDNFEVPVRTLVRSVLEAASVAAGAKNISLRDDIAQSVPTVIVGDPKRLRQVLINLVGNAIKFTPRGTVTLAVTCDDFDGGYDSLSLRFQVIDTGIGMSPESAARLFRPFSQAESVSTIYGGTGLGLSICKRLVDLMGGTIGVKSRPGAGSVFWFTLPTREAAAAGPFDEAPRLDGISILSVEDHPLAAREIARSLRSMGASVESCSTVAEAHDLIMQRPFDVGLIDQSLPDGTGLNLVRDIMRLQPLMAVAMYTGRDDPGLQQTLLSLGVEYIQKPASRIGLGHAVRKAADGVRRSQTKADGRLLVVENIESVRDVVARQLAVLSVTHADFAENAEEALRFLKQKPYAVVLTDIHMPGMDGGTLAKSIRESFSDQDNVPALVAFTADTDFIRRGAMTGFGFDECLLKPVSIEQLRRFLIRRNILSDRRDRGPLGKDTPFGRDEGHRSGSSIDRNAVIAQMGSYDENAIEMLKFFVVSSEPLLKNLKQAVEGNDTKTGEDIAHSLEGAARSACLNDLAAAVENLRKIENPTERGDWFHRVEAEYEKARAEILLL